MKIVRIYTGADGESHFEDVPVQFTEDGHFGRISTMVRAKGVLFREVDGDYDLGFHNAPRRQYVVNLKGSVEIEVGDGTKRVLGPGDVLLAEDTTGRGHISRNVHSEPRECLFIPLAE
jgi:hypothetical protein